MDHCELRIQPRDFPDPELDPSVNTPVAVMGGGCFWCVEAVFKRLQGVESVRSGYAGGDAGDADYRSVCTGTTNHAEVIEIQFDPDRISFGALLKVFFSVAHDPTQQDRQGNDRGRQYRSAVFVADDQQRQVAEAYIAQLEQAGVFSRPIVTTVEDLEQFFVAEPYHQDYADRNPNQPYIAHVSAPKVAALEREFGDQLKESSS